MYSPSNATVTATITNEQREEQDNVVSIWSKATLASLQHKLNSIEGSEGLPAQELVDNLAESFANSTPLAIADYFEAVQEVARCADSRSIARLEEIEEDFAA